MTIEATVTTDEQVVKRYEALFTPELSILDANPFRVGIPLICGRYFTGSAEPETKREVWENLFNILSLKNVESLYFKQSIPPNHEHLRELDTSIYRFSGAAAHLEMFCDLKWEHQQFFDIHLFAMDGDWALGFETSEEVVVTSMGQHLFDTFLEGVGGLVGMEESLLQDMSYLRRSTAWSKHNGLVMAWDT